MSNTLARSFVTPALQRSLAAVYRFHDAFLFPIDDRTPPVTSLLDVSIPALQWHALRATTDFTYRFSALTLTRSAPSGAGLAVQVSDPAGDYINLQTITLNLPRAVSNPPQRSDFLTILPLWPTPSFRPPSTETAVRGYVFSLAAQPVANLAIEMWPGTTATPPAGTPVTRTNENGDFLVRFPLLKGVGGTSGTMGIRIAGGAIGVLPSTLPIVFGQTQSVQFQRT